MAVEESHHNGVEISMFIIDDREAMKDALRVDLLDVGCHDVCLVPTTFSWSIS